MDSLPLNFPVFYQCAVKGNTNLSQYNAVSILLMGKLREECGSDAIGDAEAAGYISGKKRIKKVILTQVTRISKEEARKRIDDLGFQNPLRIANAIRELLAIVDIPLDVQQKIRDNLDDLDVITDAFIVAIKCPPKNVFPLGLEEKMCIALCYSKENTDAFMGGAKEKEQILIEELKSSKPKQSKSVKVGKVSATGIEVLLTESGKGPREGKKGLRNAKTSVFSEDMDPVFCSYFFQARDVETNFFFELSNIALSAGITALTDLFDMFMCPYVPILQIYDNFHYFLTQIQDNNNVRVFHKFFVGSADNYRIPSEEDVCGIIMIDVELDFIEDFSTSQIKNGSLKFFSSTQQLSYQISVHSEIGSIFSGNVATAISNFIDRPVVIKEVESLETVSFLSADNPIVVGMQPFQLNNGRIFYSKLIVSASMVHKLWKIYEEQI